MFLAVCLDQKAAGILCISDVSGLLDKQTKLDQHMFHSAVKSRAVVRGDFARLVIFSPFIAAAVFFKSQSEE